MDLWHEVENKLSKFPLHQGQLALSLVYAMQGKSVQSQQALRHTDLYAPQGVDLAEGCSFSYWHDWPWLHDHCKAVSKA